MATFEWCPVHQSGFNWHNNGPRCDAYRLMIVPGAMHGIESCEVRRIDVDVEALRQDLKFRDSSPFPPTPMMDLARQVLDALDGDA